MPPATFTTGDNLKLECFADLPSEDVKAMVVVVHGMGDHCRSLPYQFLRTFLITERIAVYSYDLRGHGASEGERHHVDRWDRFREDLDLLVNIAREELPRIPLYLLGVSLGGLIVIDYAIHLPERIAGVVALSPALSAHGVSNAVRKLVPVLARVFPRVSFDPGLDLANITRDQDAARSYTGDPLFSTRLSLRSASEILRAVSSTNAKASEVTLPILILHGDADVIVPACSSQDFFDRVSSSEKHRIVYAGARHNLLLETNRVQVYSDIAEWLAGNNR